jgi:hypothetical protein
MALNDTEIAIAKGMLKRGDAQHHVAAYFGVNQARINDIFNDKVGAHIGARAEDLPPAGPYMAGRSSLKARETLKALRDLIDETIAEIDAEGDPD